MKCPLSTSIDYEEEGNPKFHTDDCLREECAWWLEDISMCSIRELALETRYTQFRLQDISTKMPHAG